MGKKVWGTVAKIGGYAAAPFTGGASIIAGNMVGGALNQSAANDAAKRSTVGNATGFNQIGGAGADWWQRRSAINNAEDAMVGGDRQNQATLARGMGAYGTLSPYMSAGAGQLGNMTDMANIGPDQLHKMTMMDPGFEHRLETGERAVNRSAAAKGTLLGMGTMKDLTRFAQGEAAQSYDDAFQRTRQGLGDQFGRQSSLASGGLSAAGQYAPGVYGAHQDIGSLYSSIGNAQAGADIQRSNALGDFIGTSTNTMGAMTPGNEQYDVPQQGSVWGAALGAGLGAFGGGGGGASSFGAGPSLSSGIGEGVGTSLPPESLPWGNPGTISI